MARDAILRKARLLGPRSLMVALVFALTVAGCGENPAATGGEGDPTMEDPQPDDDPSPDEDPPPDDDPPPSGGTLDFSAIAGDWAGKLTAYSGACTFHAEIFLEASAVEGEEVGHLTAWFCDAPPSDNPYCQSSWIALGVNADATLYTLREELVFGGCPRGMPELRPNATGDTLRVTIPSSETTASGFVVRV